MKKLIKISDEKFPNFAVKLYFDSKKEAYCVCHNSANYWTKDETKANEIYEREVAQLESNYKTAMQVEMQNKG